MDFLRILAAVLFIMPNIGVSSGMIFFDSLLPHIAADDEIDRVSVLGYLGGRPPPTLNLVRIQFPE